MDTIKYGQEYNFTIIKNDTFSLNLNFKDKDGNVIDITNYQITFSIKKSIKDTEYLKQVQATITDGANGQAEVKILNVDLEEGTYYFDIQSVDDEGNTITFMRGKINVVYEITS